MTRQIRKQHEPLVHIVKRPAIPWWRAWLIRILAVFAALVFCGVVTLLLTGQNVNLHGICGVPLTAIETAEAIVGKNVILEKINKQ